MKTDPVVYERAAADEENEFLELSFEITSKMEKPRGWTEHSTRGRPPSKKPGHQEEFSWQGMAVVLLLQAYLDLDYRKMSSHLKARPELVQKLGFPRAPSKSQIQKCIERFPTAWLNRFNSLVLEEFKKSGVAPPS